jgi:exosome complex component RRP42
MAEDVVAEVMRDYIHRLASEGTRVDGRKIDEMRSLQVTKGLIKSAEGSAQVNLGDTTVITGVKVLAGTPYPDRPDQGTLSTSVELVPLASPTFEAGPPRPNNIELARVVDRGIRESGMIPFDKLCITPKEKVWVVWVDIHAIDYDGNLFDAASYATAAALANTKIPWSKVDPNRKDEPLPVNAWPVSVTCAKIRNDLFVDPGLEEERIAEARLTAVTDENGDVRAMQKGIGGALTVDDVERVLDHSARIGASVREKIRG